MRDTYPLFCIEIFVLTGTVTQSFNPGQCLGKQPLVYRNLRHLERIIQGRHPSHDAQEVPRQMSLSRHEIQALYGEWGSNITDRLIDGVF